MAQGVSVVAAVITPANKAAPSHQPLDAETCVLLSQRRPGKHLAGCWEFPGGRVEPDEDQETALKRELAEELGITVHAAERWCSLTHRYPEKTVSLSIYRVTDWSGVASGLEGQAIEWVPWSQVSERSMPPADQALLKLFGLAPFYLMDSLEANDQSQARILANWQERLASIEQTPLAGAPWLVQWSGCPGETSDEAAHLGRKAVEHAQQAGHICLVDGTPEWAKRLGADGVTVSRSQGMALTQRPKGLAWAAMVCDDSDSLKHATSLGLDFALLSPLRISQAQPTNRPLGGEAFGALLEQAGLPVIALGGLDFDDLAWVRSLGGFGVASRSCLISGMSA